MLWKEGGDGRYSRVFVSEGGWGHLHALMFSDCFSRSRNLRAVLCLSVLWNGDQMVVLVVVG